MRLICGFYHFDGRPAERERLDVMIAAMTEPGLGPQVACLVEGSLAMAVLDFARSEPFGLMRGASGMIVADDCRFDEPEELARVLGAGNDEKLLMALLEQRGVQGLGELLGDFALVAWNPYKHTLQCARDPMGVRPLFVTRKHAPDFAFASLPRALHAGGFAGRRLDEAQFVRQLLGRWHEPEQTVYEDIVRVLPGQALQVSAQGRSQRTFWKLDPALAGSRNCGPEAAAEELRATLERAVRCRLPRGREPVAAHLSGGLDSSTLSVLAVRMLRDEGRRLQAYSFLPIQAAFEGERPYVESVLEQEPDIDWTPLSVEDWGAYFLPRMDCDHLFPADPAGNLEIRASALAAQGGATMLLSGWGGDEGATFNGYGVMAEALLGGKWRYLAREFGALKRVRGFSSFSVAKDVILNQLVSNRLRHRLRGALGGNTSISFGVHSLLQPGITVNMAPNYVIGPSSSRNRWRALSSPHIPWRAERSALAASRYGLAMSFPMLDRRVVELAVSLPGTLFQREGWRRRVLRDAMEGVLPDKIRFRHDKMAAMGLSAAILEEQLPHLREALDSLKKHPQVERIFDLGKVREMLDSDFGHAGALTLKRTLNAAAFLEQHG